jgi:putative iron-regulated protein
MKFSCLAVAITAASLLSACGGGSSGSSSAGTDSSAVVINVDKVAQVLETNADIAFAVYSDAVTTAKLLQTALATFRAEPTDANLLAAKKAWLVAREPYLQSEVFRFRLSPIDSTDYSSEDGPEGEINSWPLGEALIDYVQVNNSDFGTDQIGVTTNNVGINGNGSVTAASHDNNIINTTSIEINDELLSNTSSADDERDVIAGYHAIEFLLWGQDLKDDATTTDGTDRDEAVKTEVIRGAVDPVNTFASGGERPLSDFVPGYDGTSVTYDSSSLSHRRHKYLQVAIDKLVADLETVRDGWADGSAYRTAFTTVTTESAAKEKLTEILTGMGTLSEGELAGERMQIAFSSNSQEDEHSCFSDNTHRDIWGDAQGISNSYYGVYAGYDSDLDGVADTGTAVSGYGLDDYLTDVGLTTLKTSLDAAFTTTETAYKAIDAKARSGVPFDVLIMDVNRNSSNPVYQTIVALNAQSGVISEMAEALGLDADVVDADASACDTSDPTASCDE